MLAYGYPVRYDARSVIRLTTGSPAGSIAVVDVRIDSWRPPASERDIRGSPTLMMCAASSAVTNSSTSRTFGDFTIGRTRTAWPPARPSAASADGSGTRRRRPTRGTCCTAPASEGSRGSPPEWKSFLPAVRSPDCGCAGARRDAEAAPAVDERRARARARRGRPRVQRRPLPARQRQQRLDAPRRDARRRRLLVEEAVRARAHRDLGAEAAEEAGEVVLGAREVAVAEEVAGAARSHPAALGLRLRRALLLVVLELAAAGARRHSGGSASSSQSARTLHEPAHCLRNPLVVHFSFVASSMQRDASSRKPATTEARCSAQLRGHVSSMYFGLRVHSPFDAQPAHCSGSA